MQPYTVHLPASRLPLALFDSPHSGRYYPEDFRTLARGADLRRGEDVLVDELILEATDYGAAVLVANYPRCYIDLNRDEDDIDTSLLCEPWPGPVAPSEKSTRGLGLIRRLITPGIEVHAGKLTAAEVRHRIEVIYRPYHDVLQRLREGIFAAHGFVWHVNWHSMKSVGASITPDGDGVRRPDFVVSDLDGRSAGRELSALITAELRAMGYRVAVNDPYKGGTIIKRYGNPRAGFHAVQVEMNRSLYLDERIVEKTGDFERFRRDILSLSQKICEEARTRIA